MPPNVVAISVLGLPLLARPSDNRQKKKSTSEASEGIAVEKRCDE